MSLRVAMTLEQCWHRIPGGTAVAGVGMSGALARVPGVEVRGVAARHRRPPHPAFAPSVPVEHSVLPRVLLYEAWHRLGRPRAGKGADVVHATSLAVPGARAPLIVTVHDLAFLHAPEQFTRRGVGFMTRGFDLARARASLVHCPSDATANDCAARGVDRARIRVVPLGVDPGRPTESEVDRALARLGVRRPFVLWTGTIEPRKNLGRLLDAFGGLDADHHLVLAGPAGWKEEAAPVAALRGRVTSLGFVARDDLTALYSAADAFCFPSLMEGFGFPVLEAMAQGTPVVTSRGTSTEEIAGDAAVLVDPRDTTSIRAGLERVLSDAGLAARLAVAGPDRARRYSWGRTAELLLDAYREVA